eukprot:6210022-Pleurochrysis_carterae.AAC.4
MYRSTHWREGVEQLTGVVAVGGCGRDGGLDGTEGRDRRAEAEPSEARPCARVVRHTYVMTSGCRRMRLFVVRGVIPSSLVSSAPRYTWDIHHLGMDI